MSDKSSIEWTDASWNPIRGIPPNRHMCSKISPGCDNCYASTMTARFGGVEYPPHRTDVEVRVDERALYLPLTWKEPRRVFVCSMTDLFGEWMPESWIDQVFAVMAWATQHQFQVLTKRPRRMLKYLRTPDRLSEIENARCDVCVRSGGKCGYPGDDCGLLADTVLPLPNVWLGTSIELDRYSWRANLLRYCPAAVRFVSAEPLLGPLPSLDLTGIDWLIAGGESGQRHRPCEAEWVRDLRDRSVAAGTAFFFKQVGGRTHAEGGRELDGRTWDEFPEPPRELAHV